MEALAYAIFKSSFAYVPEDEIKYYYDNWTKEREACQRLAAELLETAKVGGDVADWEAVIDRLALMLWPVTT